MRQKVLYFSQPIPLLHRYAIPLLESYCPRLQPHHLCLVRKPAAVSTASVISRAFPYPVYLYGRIFIGTFKTLSSHFQPIKSFRWDNLSLNLWSYRIYLACLPFLPWVSSGGCYWCLLYLVPSLKFQVLAHPVNSCHHRPLNRLVDFMTVSLTTSLNHVSHHY